MSQDTENIEARLCAYVEDELEPAARAEIEKHLAANPQHRKLIEELRATRRMLRELPRASAPADVTEALQGQLERSVLLESFEEESGRPVLRINRWTQAIAAAAIIALTAGLAVVIYNMFPTSEPPGLLSIAERSERDVDDRRPAEAPVAVAQTPVPEPPVPRAAVAAMDAAREGMLQERLGFAAAPEASTLLPLWSRPLLRQLEVAMQSMTPGSFDPMFASPADGGPVLVLVVETDQPAVANRQVARFLHSNSIIWSEYDDPNEMPQPLQLAQSQVKTATASRFQETTHRVRSQLDQEANFEYGPQRSPASQDPPDASSGPEPQPESLIIAHGVTMQQAIDLQKEIGKDDRFERIVVAQHTQERKRLQRAEPQDENDEITTFRWDRQFAQEGLRRGGGLADAAEEQATVDTRVGELRAVEPRWDVWVLLMQRPVVGLAGPPVEDVQEREAVDAEPAPASDPVTHEPD